MKLAVPLSLVLVPLVAGCLAPYQPAVPGAYGYWDEEVSPRVHQVRYLFKTKGIFPYRGPSFEELVLLRAADLTLEQGYRYFIIDKALLPGHSWGARSLTIKVFADAPPGSDVKVYDAQNVATLMRSTYAHLN